MRQGRQRSHIMSIMIHAIGGRSARSIGGDRAAVYGWLSWQLWVKRARQAPLLRNSMYILGSYVVTATAGLVFWIIAARMYSAPDVGLASALIGAMTFVSASSLLGVATALVQELPGRRTADSWSLTVNAGFATVIVAGLVASAVVAVALPRFSAQFAAVMRNAAYPIGLIAGVQLWSLTLVLDGVYVAERAAGYMLGRNTVFALLRIPLLIVPIMLVPAGTLAIFLAWILATAISLIGGWLLFISKLQHAYRPVVHGVTKQIRSMLPGFAGNHLINLGAMMPASLLPVLVATRLSTTENAYFYVTWQVGALFFTISLAVATSLLAEGSHSSDYIRSKVYSSMLIIGVLYGLALPAVLLGGNFILSLFGRAYAFYGLPLLLLLLAAAVPAAITNIYVTLLRLRRRLGTGAALSVGIGMLTLVLSWELLPRVGIAGAGLGWLIAQTAGMLVVGAHTTLVHFRSR